MGAQKKTQKFVPLPKKIFFFKKILKKCLKHKNKSPLKIRMFAKNRTLIEVIEKKHIIVLKSLGYVVFARCKN